MWRSVASQYQRNIISVFFIVILRTFNQTGNGNQRSVAIGGGATQTWQ